MQPVPGPFVHQTETGWWIWDSPHIHRLGPFPSKKAAEESEPLAHKGEYPTDYPDVGWVYPHG